MNTGDRDRLHEELIAYLEDELSPEERGAMEQAISGSDEYRTELEWLRAAYSDLEQAHQTAAKNMPAIDIVDSVMQSVRKVTAPSNVTPIAARRGASRGLWYGLAAAAVIAIAIGALVLNRPDADPNIAPPGPKVAIPPTPEERKDAPARPEGTEFPAELAKTKEQLDQQKIDLAKLAGKPSLERVPGPRIELPGTVAEIVAARRDVGGGANMDRLMEWASLQPGKAIEVALAPDATPQAMVGAAESLSGEEAKRILLTAVGKLQEDPNSRLKLARAYEEDVPAAESADPAAAAQSDTQALVQLADVKNVDPGNALPYYYEAKIQIAAGNIEAALQSLNSAKGLGTASAYSLESALAQAEALIAGGMDPDAAKMVSALTAGVDENKFLCELAADLLEYGQGFLSANETTTAEQIFQAVEELGRQVEEGASFSQEQLAGLDIQRQALDALGPLYLTIESADGVAEVTEATEALTGQIQELSSFFTALEQLFRNPMTEDFWNMVSSLVLESGDLNLFDYPEVTTAGTPTNTP